MSLLIVGLDTTIVNVALPAIHRSLHASLAGLQWIIDAYTLVLGSLLMLGGSTGDRLGRKRVFQTGLVTFVFGSALCAVAPSLGVLVAARAFQALGGAMLNPVALSIVRNVFHDPRERAQAIGMWSAMFGVSLGLGPVLGGVFVDHDRLALRLPGQRPGRPARLPADRDLRARVARRARRAGSIRSARCW